MKCYVVGRAGRDAEADRRVGGARWPAGPPEPQEALCAPVPPQGLQRRLDPALYPIYPRIGF